jgi:hypothetical protein
MNIWQNYTEEEKTVMLQQVAEKEGINEQAVERDWWVSAIMTALSKTAWGNFLQFNGLCTATHNLPYVDYNKHHPALINICPPNKYLDEWERDYNHLQESYIYGESFPFNKLLERIDELTERIKKWT